MANTYTQIHIQTIFAVQNRQSLIKNKWKGELYKYITGIIKNLERHHKTLTFKEEYLQLLKEFNIKFDERHILKSIL